MDNRAKLFNGENIRHEFESLEKELPKSHEQKDMSVNYNALSYLNKGRDLCERLCDSIIVDLEVILKKVKSNQMDYKSFTDEIGIVHKSLLALVDGGEIKNTINRANLIMLNKIAEEL